MAKMRANILVLECTTTKEKMFEGRMLKEFFKILESRIPVSGKARYVKIRNRNHFISVVRRSKEKFIHISAHGEYNKKKREARLILPYGYLTGSDIEENIGDRLKGKIVLANACELGYAAMANAFLRCKCKAYVAPYRRVEWVDAGIFAILFYKAVLLDFKGDVVRARDYVDRLKNIDGCYSVWVPPPPAH